MVNAAPNSEFEYVAGIKVETYDKVPKVMVVMEVLANRYTVFARHGALNTLRQTYAGICGDWFPLSGNPPSGGYNMGAYTEEFKDFVLDPVFYIYEAVK